MNTLTCGGKNKKRFSDEQIKSLEVMFRSDSRPESRTKQQLAGEVGLQPRQVAIWFQNRRARSRTKQIEREYNILKSRYNTLVSNIESLKRENQALNIQVTKHIHTHTYTYIYIYMIHLQGLKPHTTHFCHYLVHEYSTIENAKEKLNFVTFNSCKK